MVYPALFNKHKISFGDLAKRNIVNKQEEKKYFLILI
jgi:hypothetical protein